MKDGARQRLGMLGDNDMGDALIESGIMEPLEPGRPGAAAHRGRRYGGVGIGAAGVLWSIAATPWRVGRAERPLFRFRRK